MEQYVTSRPTFITSKQLETNDIENVRLRGVSAGSDDVTRFGNESSERDKRNEE